MSGVKESLQNLKEKLPEPLSTLEFTLNIMISVGIGLLTVFLVLLYVWSRKSKVLPSMQSGPSKPRFRKRDKVMFYGRKMLRRVRSLARFSVAGARRAPSKKKIVLKLARKLLRFKKDQQPQLKVREPPPSFLEADWLETEHSEHLLPMEVMYMLKSIRVLGHFETPIFLELYRFMESRFVPAGTHLFKIGDMDDSIYVVQNGKLNVFITDPDGTEQPVKEVNSGESIHSLLSILDILTGHSAPYKTVTAVAVTDSTVLRLPAKAFQVVLERFPESMVRVVQIIMVRLQRVTFMALHNYLGLSFELMNPVSHSDKRFSIHSITMSPKGTPVRIPTDNKSVMSSSEGERITKVINYDDDFLTENSKGTSDTQDTKKRNIPTFRRGGTESQAKPTKLNLGEIERKQSDFEAACARARAVKQPDEDPVICGTPPRQHSHEYMEEAALMNKKSGKKAAFADNVSFIPTPDEGRSHSSKGFLQDEEILQMATDDLNKLLGLEDESLLVGKVYLRYVKRKATLIKQGDQDASLYFVVTGQLDVQQQVVGNESEERMLFTVYPGELVGPLAVLTGEPSFFTIRAISDAVVALISKQDFYVIMKKQPHIVLNVGHTVVRRMSSFVRQIDFALDWMLIEAGRALFRQGEHSDCIYIVLNGRLRSVVTSLSGKKELVGEYGRGELVGLVEVLTQTERATTLIAVRDTELAQIPDELLNLIKRKYPQVVARLIHLLGQRILGSLKNRTIYSTLSEHPNVESRPAVGNLATVAVLPVTDDVPLSNFTLELQHALNNIGLTLRLTSEIIQNKLGIGALDSVNEYRLSSWLGQQEDIHRMVLYQCDYQMTPWTKRCITQADCILIVAFADQEPTVGQTEKQMENLAVRAQKELILLYREDSSKPTNTVQWLNLRGWCSSHHHILCPKRMFSRKSKTKMREMYRKVLESEPDMMSDFSRLARFLSGTAVGLVLGGGGARGIAHVGLIRAMAEAGVPIDIVGGTSIGSFMGALWAEERNITRFTQRAREWSVDMASLWKKILDLTYPITAMFSGGSFNRSIENVFKDRQIEDLWIPYFCITTDITASKMRVHTNGSLWRYVRASMSLSGYLPPMCDPVDGNLLLDGGYVNNLPADIMKAMGAQTIFAVDVGSQDDTPLTNYGDDLSGWWLLWKKWNPWAAPVKVPDMAEIQSRLAYVSCVRQLEQVKDSSYCEYLRPPIDKYQTLQFGSFDDIHDEGFHYGNTLFSTLASKGLLKDMMVEQSRDRIKPILHKTVVPAEAKFTDLAELISRIDEPRSFDRPKFSSEESEEEEEPISITSEPSMSSLTAPKLKLRSRGGSEGATPGSTPSEEFQDTDFLLTEGEKDKDI